MTVYDPTFEALRDDLTNAPAASDVGERNITWVDPGRTLAFSRDQAGRLELFLVGPPLIAHEPSLREHLMHDIWLTDAGTSLHANRVWLPGGDHFNAVAATILVELLGNEYPADGATAFRRTESLVALVLAQSRAEGALVTGLAGELLTLVALIKAPDSPVPETLAQSWQGWQRSSRDFQLGPVGVEVKTSTTGMGRHHIQGWYQVEPGVAADGSLETHFHLLSLGIQWLTQDSSGHTIEGLVYDVLKSLPENLHPAFLAAVRGYGGGQLSIDDAGIAAQQTLRRPFVATYERLYDMSDDRIQVPRSGDLAQFGELVTDSVTFEIQLPTRVRGDRNPVVGFGPIVATILSEFAS